LTPFCTESITHEERRRRANANAGKEANHWEVLWIPFAGENDIEGAVLGYEEDKVE
jgi:hypothetical protein